MIQKLSLLSPATANTIQTKFADNPKLEFTARWISSVAELESLVPVWQRLMETALHRNLMFDPDFLIPAYKYFADSSVRILVIEGPQKSKPNEPLVLCGLIPLQKSRVYGMPLSGLTVWLHDQCVDGTPLVRSDCAKQVLNFLLDFLAESEKTSLLSLDSISNEGQFAELLTDVLFTRNNQAFHRGAWTRACFRPELDAETYFEKHVSGGVKRTQRRLTRRLEEQGEVTVTIHGDEKSRSEMIDHFLRLEASGWKGNAGTALECDLRREKFFREMVMRSLPNQKISFLAVNLNGQPIAMLCDLYSAGIGYSFKTAFDESLKEFSPGVMVELKNIEYLHETDVISVDSCAMPDNETINRIWGGRVRFQSLVVPLGGRLSQWAVATMPILQQLARLRK